MGVPVITLAGERYVERLSATKLVAVGVPELITENREQYIEKAVALSQDSNTRQHYHQTLRHKMNGSELCDPVSLARDLEAVYRKLWQQYCQDNADRANKY